MVDAATALPDETGPNGAGIEVNPLLQQLRPDPLGPQHDEREPGFWGIRWPKGLRHVDPEAILHSSVYARTAAERVPHFTSILSSSEPRQQAHPQPDRMNGLLQSLIKRTEQLTRFGMKPISLAELPTNL